jgi:Tat protein secretion system quality control protein TatD with DNase activity
MAQAVAQLKNISVDEVAEKTTDNFFQLFNKIPRNTA